MYLPHADIYMHIYIRAEIINYYQQYVFDESFEWILEIILCLLFIEKLKLFEMKSLGILVAGSENIEVMIDR